MFYFAFLQYCKEVIIKSECQRVHDEPKRCTIRAQGLSVLAACSSYALVNVSEFVVMQMYVYSHIPVLCFFGVIIAADSTGAYTAAAVDTESCQQPARHDAHASARRAACWHLRLSLCHAPRRRLHDAPTHSHAESKRTWTKWASFVSLLYFRPSFQFCSWVGSDRIVIERMCQGKYCKVKKDMSV